MFLCFWGFLFFENIFSHPFGLFIFLNLQSIWFLCFGIVVRFCVSVCVGLSQLLYFFVCVILLQFLQFLCVFDFVSIFVAIYEYIDFFQLLQFLCVSICLSFCCKSYVCQFLSQFVLQFLCVLTFVSVLFAIFMCVDSCLSFCCNL